MNEESKIQKKIIDFLKSEGAYVVKTIVCSKNGIPDLLCCYRGQFMALEVKTDEGKTTALQEYNLKEIEKAGGIAITVRSIDDVKSIIFRN
jgi:Holliday junction resolvase